MQYPEGRKREAWIMRYVVVVAVVLATGGHVLNDQASADSIWKSNPKTKKSTKMVTLNLGRGQEITEIRWRPGTESFTYGAGVGGGEVVDIYMTDGLGSKRRLVKRAVSGLMSEAPHMWSPDGLKIMYLKDRGRELMYYDLMVLDIATMSKEQVNTKDQHVVSMDWSRDSSSVLYTDGQSVYEVSLGSSTQREVLRSRTGGLAKIVVSKEGRVAAADEVAGVFVGDPRVGKGLTLVTKRRPLVDQILWPINSNRIYYLRLGDAGDQVYGMRPNGKGKQRITRKTTVVMDISAAPNGRSIAYTQNRPGIYVINTMTRRVRRVNRYGSYRLAWENGPGDILYTR